MTPIGRRVCGNLLRWSSVVLLASVCSLPGGARAAGEEEWQLSAGAVYAALAVDGRQLSGGGPAVEVVYGLTDALAARVAADVLWHRLPAEAGFAAGTLNSAGVFAGVTYTLDVFRLVPFLDAGVGGEFQWGDPRARRSTLGGELGLGCQYLLSPRFALAVSARYRYLPLDLSTHPNETPSLFTVGPRASWIF